MSHFQLSTSISENAEQALKKCLDEIIKQGIQTATVKTINAEDVIGLKVHIRTVDENLEASWSRTIEKVVKNSGPEIQVRFTFFNPYTKNG